MTTTESIVSLAACLVSGAIGALAYHAGARFSRPGASDPRKPHMKKALDGVTVRIGHKDRKLTKEERESIERKILAANGDVNEDPWIFGKDFPEYRGG